MSNIFTDFLSANKVTLIRDGEKTLIACDAVKSEDHRMLAEATQFEIEDGSNIHDHVINRGKTLTIEGIISDDPITIFQTGLLDRTVATATPGILKSKLGHGLSGDKGKPSKEAFDQLEKIYDNKIPVTIITGLKKYDNMIMEELNIPRTSKTVRSLEFTATFRQIRIVSTQLTTAPNTYQEKELGAQKKKNIGTQGPKTIVETDNRTFFLSVGQKVSQWFSNWFGG